MMRASAGVGRGAPAPAGNETSIAASTAATVTMDLCIILLLPIGCRADSSRPLDAVADDVDFVSGGILPRCFGVCARGFLVTERPKRKRECPAGAGMLDQLHLLW